MRTYYFRFYSFVAVLSLSLFSTASMASELLDMLKRMSEVDEKQNYQGVFILRKSDTLSTLRVTHGIDAKGVWESLEALNGEPRKVVRRNNRVVSVFPKRELVTIRQGEDKPPLHRRLPENIDQLEQFYTIHQLADDRIANHDALVVDLVPEDTYRYGYRYWLDKNTGMLLRCDLVANDGSIIEQMMFTSLNYLTVAPVEKINLQQFEQFKQQVIMDDTLANSVVGENHGWVINHLPKGFMLIRSNMRYSQPMVINNVAKNESDVSNDNERVTDLLHLVYSDGLASVSVFIKKNLEEENHYEGISSMGAINAFGNFVDDYFVTVVGVVPVNTVQLMAQSAVRAIAGLSE